MTSYSLAFLWYFSSFYNSISHPCLASPPTFSVLLMNQWGFYWLRNQPKYKAKQPSYSKTKTGLYKKTVYNRPATTKQQAMTAYTTQQCAMILTNQAKTSHS